MNNDLIRRGELLGNMPKDDVLLSGEVRKVICEAPAVDAVEVVRCEKCRNCKTIFPEKRIGQEPTQVLFCEIYRCNRKPDEFCSDGERRKNNG